MQLLSLSLTFSLSLSHTLHIFLCIYASGAAAARGRLWRGEENDKRTEMAIAGKKDE